MTKSVSNLSVSADRVTLASGLVIKESFRQEFNNSNKDMAIRPVIFIGIKNNVSISLRHKGARLFVYFLCWLSVLVGKVLSGSNTKSG